MTSRSLPIATCFVILAACAHAPSTYPPGSAAAPEAAAAPPWSGGRALVEDPPLPGAATTGWEGLASGAPADPHAGHHMHHGHGAMVVPDHGAIDPSDASEPSSDAGVDGGTDPMEMEMHHAH